MSDGEERRWKLNRRTLLKNAASGSALIGLSSLGAASTTNKQVVIKQGNKQYALDALTYNNWSVEQFYSYGYPNGASANTPVGLEESGVSKLFVYDGLNGLSLVFIHDKPDDWSGGSVTFDFNGLPNEGSWIIPDDAGDGPTRNRVDWDWAPCCTDGGAYRGGLDDGFQMSITPQFYGGIERWVALSGDPASPREFDLDKSKPLTITTDTSDSPQSGFTAVKKEKLQLADEITALSPSINERVRVRNTLDAIQQGVQNGTVDESTAIDAVERMKMGENIYESTVAALGPTVTETPENTETLIGAPSGHPAADSGYDIAGTTVENGLFLGVSFFTLSLAFARLAGKLGYIGSRVGSAIETTDDILTGIFGAIPFIGDRLKDTARFIRDNVATKIESDSITEGARLYDIVAGQIQEYRDPYANDLISAFEQDLGDSFDHQLAEFDDALGLSGDSLQLNGSQSDAKMAAKNGMNLVNDRLRDTKNSLTVTKFVAGVSDVLAIAGGLITLLSGGTLFWVGAALGLVGTFFGISFTFLGTVAGADGIFDAQAAHSRALDSIVSGIPEV